MQNLKSIYSLVGLVFGVGISAQLTPGANYLYTKTYVTADTDSLQKPAVENVAYFDGLGKLKQNIAIKATNTGKDLVVPFVYDGFGRQILDVLPSPVMTRNGGYQDGVVNASSANAYYQSINLGGRAYSEKKFENSPLDRVLQQYQPGEAWASKPVNFSYKLNVANEVRFYAASFNYNTFSSSITVNGSYPANSLYKNILKDEDGNTTIEFKNKDGQIVLVRKVLADSDQDVFILPQDPNSYTDTYYVYNDYNQLAYVVPPLAANTGSVSSSTLDNLCYQYKYDGKNRLVEKKVPGKGWEYMVYDKSDRLVLTQDANLASTTNNFGRKGWLFTKYDRLGRIAYTGFFSNTATRVAMQNALDNMNSINVEERTITPSATLQGLDLYYTKKAFPTGSMTLLSVNYYDTYPVETPFPTENMVFDQKIMTDIASDENGYRSTKSMALASFVKNIENDSWTKSYSFFDDKGRVIATHSANHLGGNTTVHSRLDLSGTLLKSKTYHSRLTNEIPIIILEEFVYDDQNRLTEHYHTIEDYAPRELLAYNQYDELGRLIHKKVGGSDVSDAIESTNYDYNIRGWMTGINLTPKNVDAEQPVDANQLFSYKIKYDNSVNPALKKYNGNISEVDWGYKDTGTSNRYEYTYDKLNRLKKADYKTMTGVSTTSDSRYYNEEVSYDINGNITTLKRYAKPLMGLTGTLIDNLSYTYSNAGNSNQLLSIRDTSKNRNGYPVIASPQDFSFDKNGNTIMMSDKGISNISYNHLNLPSNIVQRNNNTDYLYRADGTKVFKKFYINGETLDTDYLDGFVYTTLYSFEIAEALTKDDIATREAASAGQMETFELVSKEAFGPGNPPMMPATSPEFFLTSEGFYDYKNAKYIYQYKDHLGNVRLSYSKNYATGLIDIEDQNDYYAFGLSFVDASRSNASMYSPSTSYTNWKYNGKELQETGMYNYGARFYMPDIGRWGVVDSAIGGCQQSSSYNYVLNNPISNATPDGLRILTNNDPSKKSSLNILRTIDKTENINVPDFYKRKLDQNNNCNLN